ncbi:DUF6119 family protein [Fodinicola acaciae]|uniref:DUF6119 family protein n=1 Tax=Fodinicola acaciae TaxID=2681555 RepID=UPI0013D81357|nr:DUF6119 family protein [Fodinicola acaciae]
MKLNLFRIPEPAVKALRKKFMDSGMVVTKRESQAGWRGAFYYSAGPARKVSWAETFRDYLEGQQLPLNRNAFAAFIFTRKEDCFVLSFGKTHFFIRPYCDYDFGIELAKRIADENDSRQTASRRYQTRRKKDIKSYATDTPLDVESGEAVEYLQMGIVTSKRERFGVAGKFGTSALLQPDIETSEIGKLLTDLVDVLAEPEQFPLPRTTTIKDEDEIAHFDELLLDELTSDAATSELTHNSYDLYGVDFIFNEDGKFVVSCRGGGPRTTYDHLTIQDLRTYIQVNKISRDSILNIRIHHEPDDATPYTKPLKESIDFIADDEQVLLTGGQWTKFNQDYLKFLDQSIAAIDMEPVEAEFAKIVGGEPAFNISAAVKRAGYAVADKDFSIFKTRSSTPVEAWDLSRDGCVYAVKFGTPQKLGYVCDQALNVLELIRNRANVNDIPDFTSYCLWFGYEAKRPLTDLRASGSIILKQKIDNWARKARDLGIRPVIKLSHRPKS